MRRATKETLEFCHDIEMIIATKPRIEDKKIVVTWNILSRQKLARVQCNARKVRCDKDSYVMTNSPKINNTSHEKFVMTRILMSRQTFQRVKSSRHKLCRDIAKLCRDKTSRDQQSKIANFVTTSNSLVATNLLEIKV